MSNEEILKKLKKYYDENCKKLVFIGEQNLEKNHNCKMYFLDVSVKQELLNYQKLFQEYLLFYIRNRDLLSYYNNIICAETDNQISEALMKEGKIIHDNTGLYPQADVKKMGLYGELFDDFYINIVKSEEVITTYSIRSSFNHPNVKGVDIIGATIVNDEFELIFSEAKFINSISSASNNLCKDILGDDKFIGHVTKSYINEYTSFFLNKSHSVFFDDNLGNIIMEKINELNRLIIQESLSPIEAINKLNIKIRFDFFAIYHDTNYVIENRKQFFDKIIDAFNQNIKATEINKYDIEIIFIPTKNQSVDIKEAFETWN